ncbi:MAG: transglycosylase domain-containing protein [Dehalococcoidia bacterium]
MNAIRKKRIADRRRSRYDQGGGAFGKIMLFAALGLFTLGIISATAAVGAVYAVYRHYADDYVPIEQKLKQVNAGLTEIYDRGGPADGVFLGALTNPDAQLLNPVPLGRMSPWVVEATISTEDDTFYKNPGINWRGLVRAAKENYIDGEIGSGTGGSSITQQLIKNVYICPSINTGDDRICVQAERTLDRKLREIAYALELEQDYTKDQILEWYLNQISYADRYIGIEAAAQGYFRKTAADLTLAESALLAGIPSSPSLYHPRENCLTDDAEKCVTDAFGRTAVGGRARARQETVLELMIEHGRATRAQVDEALAEPLLIWPRTNPIKAAAFIDNQVEPRLIRMCNAGLLPQIEGATDCYASVHSAGWKVTTTLDYRETAVATEMIRTFVADGLSKGCECHNAAIATIDPGSGQMIVYAPNADPENLTDARVKGDIDQLNEINQPGSSFKPVVYFTWFDKLGRSPMNTFWDTSPLKVENTEITNPRNDGKSGEGLISARAALGGSQNVGAFRAAAEAGVDNVIEAAKKFGITTLGQNFDPTFRSHPDVTYGASIATGGANIRAIDMAYANSVFANMGVMVGVPHLAATFDPKELKSTALDTGLGYDEALRQRQDFAAGHIRLPGTRELDPVVVLRVEDRDGNVLYDHHTKNDLKRVQVVNPGSVWLVHSIISDCTSRFIIWGCGTSNDDVRLESFVDGAQIPTGVKTGTQQGPKDAKDTLETWMVGYSRHAGVALWVGNANNDLVKDGPSANFAAANTTVKLFKNWMGEYHGYLKRLGLITAPATFNEVRPNNVAQVAFKTPATDRGSSGGCEQTMTSWVRTDIKQYYDCDPVEVDSRNNLLVSDQVPREFRTTKFFPRLPAFKPEGVAALAERMGIALAPTRRSTGLAAVSLSSPKVGDNISAPTAVTGAVASGRWQLEFGSGPSPSSWTTIRTGEGTVDNGTLGTFDPAGLEDGVYAIRLSATGGFAAVVLVNVRKNLTPTPSATPSGTPTGPTPSVTPPQRTSTPTPTETLRPNR